MMATEMIPDARHEAIVALTKDLYAVEQGDSRMAENHTQVALASIRDMPRKATT